MKFTALWEFLTHNTDYDGQSLQYKATLGIIVDLRLGKTQVSESEHQNLVSALDAELKSPKDSTPTSRLIAANALYQHEVREVCGCDAAGQRPSIA